MKIRSILLEHYWNTNTTLTNCPVVHYWHISTIVFLQGTRNGRLSGITMSQLVPILNTITALYCIGRKMEKLCGKPKVVENSSHSSAMVDLVSYVFHICIRVLIKQINEKWCIAVTRGSGYMVLLCTIGRKMEMCEEVNSLPWVWLPLYSCQNFTKIVEVQFLYWGSVCWQRLLRI